MSERISRRDFLKVIAVTGAAAFASAGCEVAFPNKEHDKEIAINISEYIKNQYRIKNFYFGEGYVANTNDIYSYPLKLGYNTATSAMETLYSNLSLYPPVLFDNMSTIPWSYLISENLKHFDSESETWEDWAGTVILNRSGIEKIVACERNGLARLTHHEIFHLIVNNLFNEASLYGQFSAINQKYNLAPYDEEESFQQASQCLDNPPPQGVSRCYGAWKAEEDTATIAEAIMTVNRDFIERLATDEALNEKTDAVKRVYEKASQGYMNNNFFESLISGTQNPWNRPGIPAELYSQ